MPQAVQPTPGKPDDLEQRVRKQFERKVEAGRVLFEEGDPGEAVYVIRFGQVELTRLGPSGRRLLARLGAGELFGGEGVLLGSSHMVRAQAAAATLLLEIDRETFRSMCMERPEIAVRLLGGFAARVRDLEKQLAGFEDCDSTAPLARALVRRAGPGGGEVRLQTTLRELAHESELSMLQAYRALGELMDRKAVKLVDDVLVFSESESLTGPSPD